MTINFTNPLFQPFVDSLVYEQVVIELAPGHFTLEELANISEAQAAWLEAHEIRTLDPEETVTLMGIVDIRRHQLLHALFDQALRYVVPKEPTDTEVEDFLQGIETLLSEEPNDE